jgi:hypothetical protein
MLVALAATGFATPIKRTATVILPLSTWQVTELKSFSGGVTAALIIVHSTGGPLFLTHVTSVGHPLEGNERHVG